MGLPAIQLIMIAARQVSKPIAEAMISYGKSHPLFRNRVLIPVGRSLVHLTTRLRMKRLGLGSPTSVATVSEATALEQASDFIQQVVLFSYSVGVFAAYYYYTKWTTSETMKLEDFEKWMEEAKGEREELHRRIGRLEEALIAAKFKLPPLPAPVKKEEVEAAAPAAASPPPPPAAAATAKAAPAAKETCPSSPTAPSSSSSSSSSAPSTPLPSSTLRFPRISSLPLDSASRIVLEGEEFTLCRRDASISLERGDPDTRFLRFKPVHKPPYSPGFVGLSERALSYIVGSA